MWQVASYLFWKTVVMDSLLFATKKGIDCEKFFH